jgi:hypothetical protein
VGAGTLSVPALFLVVLFLAGARFFGAAASLLPVCLGAAAFLVVLLGLVVRFLAGALFLGAGAVSDSALGLAVWGAAEL